MTSGERLDRARPRRGRRAGPRRRPRRRAGPGSRNAPLAFAGVRRAARGGSGCTPASTSGPPASSRSAWRGPPRARSPSSPPPAPRSPTCTRRCSRPRTPACRCCCSPPTGPPGCAAPAPTRPPTRCGLFGAAVRLLADVPAATPAAARWSGGRRSRVAARAATATGRLGGRPGRCTSTCSSRSRWCPDAGDGWGIALDGRRTADRGWRRATAAAVRPTPVARACAPSWWPVTTPGRPPGCSPRGRLAAAGRAHQRLAHRRQRDPHLPAAARRPELADRIEQVVVFGHPTLSRPVAGCSPATTSSCRRGPRPVRLDRPRPPRAPACVDAGASADGPATDGPDRVAGRSGATATPTSRAGSTRCSADRGRADAAPRGRRGERRRYRAGGLLFVGASNPVRDLDLMVPRYPVGERRMVVANRGLAGIDGIGLDGGRRRARAGRAAAATSRCSAT